MLLLLCSYYLGRGVLKSMTHGYLDTVGMCVLVPHVNEQMYYFIYFYMCKQAVWKSF